MPRWCPFARLSAFRCEWRIPGVNCFHCGSSHLRLSRMRTHDFGELFLLQIPACRRTCHERFYVSLYRAWKLGLLRKAANKRRQQERDVGGGSAVA